MSSAERCKRNRGWLLICIILCILLGLASRSSLPLPSIYKEYGGDVLWSAMFYFIFAFVQPNTNGKTLLVLTVLFSFLIEFSQMIDVDWLNAARQTPLRYLLGQGFQTSDLICYVIGSSVAYAIDNIQKKSNIS